ILPLHQALSHTYDRTVFRFFLSHPRFPLRSLKPLPYLSRLLPHSLIPLPYPHRFPRHSLKSSLRPPRFLPDSQTASPRPSAPPGFQALRRSERSTSYARRSPPRRTGTPRFPPPDALRTPRLHTLLPGS